MSCHPSCSLCTGPNFYNCLMCDLPSLKINNMCQQQPIYALQIAITISLLIFILPHIFHYRRFMVLSKIYNYIQFVSYFKYLLIYEPYRHCYLSILGRGWGEWNEGWNLLDYGSGVGLWFNQETIHNKSARIAAYFVAVILISVLVGVFKTVTAQQNFKFSMYFKKNWLHALVLATYINVQDISFIVAEKLYYQNSTVVTETSTSMIVQTAFSIGFVAILLTLFYVLLYGINIVAKDPPPNQEYYYHANMFMFAYQFDKFPTISLLEKQNNKNATTVRHKKFNYSNLRIVDVLTKIIYPFVIISSLNGNSSGVQMSLFGLFVFSELLFWIIFPFEFKQEYVQIIIVGISQVAVILLLFLYGKGVLNEIGTYFLVLFLVLLGLISLILEIFLKKFNLVPIDLYETGSNIYINIYANDNNKSLEMAQQLLKLKMLQLQQENKKKLNQMDEQQRRRQLKRQQLQKELQDEIQRLKQLREKEEDQKKRKQLQWQQAHLRKQREKYMTQQQKQIQSQKKDIREEVANKFSFDFSDIPNYEWDKDVKFHYSNKIEE